MLSILLFAFVLGVFCDRLANRRNLFGFPPLIRTLGLGVGVLAGLAMLLLVALRATDSERQWDMVAFWLAGKTAVEGGSPYVPGAYLDVDLPFEAGESFRREVLEVGDLYPPITLLLFAPLGMVSLASARVVWLLATLAVLTLFTGLLLRRLPLDNGKRFLLVAGVLLANRATFDTIYYSQTNFLVATLALLFFASSRPAFQGLFLALGVLVKPWLAFLLLPCLLLGRRRAALFTGGFLSLAVIAAARLFGPGVFLDYLSDPPFLRRPTSVLWEGVNQSLLAAIQRLAPVNDPLQHPLFPMVAVLLLAWTLSVALETRDKAPGALWMTFLCLALMLYPGTLTHYLFLLVLPILHLWLNREALPWSGWQTALHLALVLGLAGWRTPELGFFALLYCWTLCIVLARALEKSTVTELRPFFAVTAIRQRQPLVDVGDLEPAYSTGMRSLEVRGAADLESTRT